MKNYTDKTKMEEWTKEELIELLKDVSNNVRSQMLHQALGLKKDDKHRVKDTWHARGGFDACKWILEQTPQLDIFTNLMNMEHPQPFTSDVQRIELMDKKRRWS